LRNFLEDVFKKTTDDIWYEGFAEGVAWERQILSRKAALIRDLNNGNWDFPKGTRREDAVKMIIEECAQIAEATEDTTNNLAYRSHV